MDKYNRIRKLGEGASGKVYLIENRENGELSVAKQINAVISVKDRANAVQEAKLLKSMSHPNIVKLQDVFMTTAGKVLILMEYADGGDLSQRIVEQRESRQGLLPEVQCLEWLVQAGFALCYLHKRKVLHRDIKTRNLFLYSSGLLKIGDFGIACILDTTVAMAQTVVGTLYYLSPELVQRTPYSFKSDVWALGIVLYELAALKQPFDSKSLHELLQLIVKGEYQPLDDMYSIDLKSLIRSMLMRDPADRPAVVEMLRLPFLQHAFTNVNEKYSLGLEMPAEPLLQTRDSDECSASTFPDAGLNNSTEYVADLVASQNFHQPESSCDRQPMEAKRLMHHPQPCTRPPSLPPPGPPPGACLNAVTPRFAAKANALPLLKPQMQAGAPSAVLRGAGMQMLMAPNNQGVQAKP